VDLNSASKEELERVGGLGRERAERSRMTARSALASAPMARWAANMFSSSPPSARSRIGCAVGRVAHAA